MPCSHHYVSVLSRPLLGVGLVVAACLPLAVTAAVPVPKPEEQVRRILSARCFKCHGEQVRLGGLDLRTPEAMRKGGSSGPALVPGWSTRSLIYRRVADGSMPPGGEPKLTRVERQVLRSYIDGQEKVGPAPRVAAPRAARGHWAFSPPVMPRVPAVRDGAWVRTPIDAFLLARMDAAGVRPAPPADRRTLLRRAYLDLIGLPPTLTEQADFLADRSPDAYEKVVDRLLARPEYGERWARHWLDVVRYAETNGYERDGNKPHAWRYRDYVIRSLNDDKPYDRFLTEQIAGDEVEGSSAETQIATTFLRLGTWDDEPAEPMLDRYDQLDDVLGTTATAFMGVTLRCARCHDHKFEPFSQKDYYRVLALFEPLKRPQEGRSDLDRLVGTRPELETYRQAKERSDAAVAAVQAQIDALNAVVLTRLEAKGVLAIPPEALEAFRIQPSKRTAPQAALVKMHGPAIEKSIREGLTADEPARLAALESEVAAAEKLRPVEPPRAYVLFEDTPKPAATRLLVRGDPARPGEEMSPGLPTVLASQPPEPPKPLETSSGRRLWLARWLASRNHPLTARVIVNRIWQQHFGEGLVASESDFGIVGQRPSHPELLDWLALQFTTHSPRPWSLKSLHRLIVTSSAYRMSSRVDARAKRIDPENRLLTRWRQRRLDAEAVRDSVLAVSGALNPERFGPSVYPEIPRPVLEGQSRPGEGWGKSTEAAASRRSVYIFAKRSLAVPELEVLDAPDTTSSCEQRLVSTIAPQALTFLNGEFIQRQAALLAARVQREAGAEARRQVELAFVVALCRPATPAEVRSSLSFLTTQQRQIEADDRKSGKASSEAQPKALAAFCLVLLNTNEFAYLN